MGPSATVRPRYGARVRRPTVPLALSLALAVLAPLGMAACGGDAARRSGPRPSHPVDAPPSARERAEERARARRPPAPTCPPDAGNCAAAAGRVIALESVDPDGDGDLHLVLAGGSVTLPGITVLDIAPSLRPRRDPRIGDWAAGAGPVYRGSYGQRQIQVERVVYWPRR